MTILNFRGKANSVPRGARGYRAYVIGDVHGRLDLLTKLLDQVQADMARQPARKVLLVFLGDLIDRGPHSAQVIELLRNFRSANVRTVFLMGNHEEVLLRILGGDASLIPSWLQFGGAECLRSYGADPKQVREHDDEKALTIIRLAIPKKHVEFLKRFDDTCRFGDYLFVHAGLRPGIPLEEQLQNDLRWIRQPFLTDETDHGCVVVHGHTISAEVEERANRIGIDTGAYRTGVLTALVIEGDQRRYLDTRQAADA